MVVVLAMASLQPFGPACRGRLREAFLRQHDAIGGVRPRCRGALSEGVELFEGILPHCREHRKPQLAVLGVDLLNEAPVHERRHAFEYVHVQIAMRIADRFRTLDRTGTGEHREPAKEPPFGLAEQLVAPVDRLAEGLLPDGKVAPAAGQDVEAALEAGSNLHGGQDAGARRRQLDCERQAIDAGTNLRDCCRVLRRQRERLLHGCGPLDKQRDRRVDGQRLDRRQRGQVGNGKRRHVKALLAEHVQYRPTRDEDRQRRAGLQHRDQERRRWKKLFEVVQHEQRTFVDPAPYVFAKRGVDRSAVDAVEPKSLRDHGADVVDVGNRAEAHEMHSAGKRRDSFRRDVQGEPGLAAAARAGHGHETRIRSAEQPPQICDLLGPADQRRPWHGEGRRRACACRLGPLMVLGAVPRVLGSRARDIGRI